MNDEVQESKTGGNKGDEAVVKNVSAEEAAAKMTKGLAEAFAEAEFIQHPHHRHRKAYRMTHRF